MPAERRAAMALPAAVFLAALLPRAWALDWGLPLKRAHIDEAVVMHYSLRVTAGEVDPGFHDYPGLFLYALAALFRVVTAAGSFAGSWAGPDEALSAAASGETGAFLLAARGLNAFLGAGCALLAYGIGRKLAGPAAGALAGLLTAWDGLAVLHSHYATTDTLAFFLSLAALDCILDAWSRDDDGRVRWAGFLTGLAAAAKYYPAVLATLLLPAPFLLRRRRPWREASAAAALSAAGFLAGSPYTLLAFPAFVERFSHLFPKIVGGAGGALPFLPTLAGLWRHAGPAACAFAVAGLVAALRGAERGWKVVAAAFLGLAVFFGLWSAQSAHYALLLHPLVFLLAARGVVSLARFGRAPVWAASLLLLLFSIPTGVRDLRPLAVRDTRLAALDWVRANVPAGGRLLRFAHTPEFTSRDPYGVRVDWENRSLSAVGDGRELPAGTGYILFGTYDPAGDPGLRALMGRFRLLRSFSDPASRFPHHPSVFVFSAEAPS